MSLVIDIAKFSIIIYGLGSVFGFIGMTSPFATLPTCTDDLIANQQGCMPALAGDYIVAGDENRDAFSLFTDALVLMTNNPVGSLVLPLPKLLLVASVMPDGSINKAIVAFAGIFTSLFGFSLLLFAVQMLRGIGFSVFKE